MLFIFRQFSGSDETNSFPVKGSEVSKKWIDMLDIQYTWWVLIYVGVQ